MLRKIRLVLPLTLIVSVFVTVPVAAHNGVDHDSNVAAETVDAEKDETFEQEVKRLTTAEDKKKTQAVRTKERTEALKIKLSAAEQAKLKQKCVGAQGVIKNLDTKIDNGVVSRGKAYNELLDHLDKIIAKLKANNVDVAELEKEKTELQKKIDLFKVDLASYKVALADAKGLGCVEDPAAFKAALEAARAARKTVATDAAAVRTYVTETIKPTLKKIRESLDKQKTDTTTETTPTTGGTQ